MRNIIIEMFLLVRLKEAINNGVPVYDSVAEKDGGYGKIHQDNVVFKIGAFWEPLVPEEITILYPENAPHLQGPTSKNDKLNGPIKDNVKNPQEFDINQFHKITRLTYLCGKEVEKYRELPICLKIIFH